MQRCLPLVSSQALSPLFCWPQQHHSSLDLATTITLSTNTIQLTTFSHHVCMFLRLSDKVCRSLQRIDVMMKCPLVVAVLVAMVEVAASADLSSITAEGHPELRNHQLHTQWSSHQLHEGANIPGLCRDVTWGTFR